MNRFLRITGLVFTSAVLIAGCLDMDSTITLDRNGAGRIDLTYRISADLYRLGVFDTSDVALPIPISQAEFERTAGMIDGLELARYRVNEEVEEIVVDVRLRFDSVATLDRWYSGAVVGPGDGISVESRGSQSVWRQVLVPGNGGTGTNAQALALDLEGYSLTFTVAPPGPIVSSNLAPGDAGGDRTSVTILLSDIVTATEPITWEVVW